jgi:hypothetical protein
MPLAYSQNKKHIDKWVANNPDKYREICRIKQRRYDEWKRVSKIYLSILLD